MQKKLPVALQLMLIHWSTLMVLSYMYVAEPTFTINHSCKPIGQLHVAHSTALDLCAVQLYTSLNLIIEFVFKATLPIDSNAIERQGPVALYIGVMNN